MYSLEKDYIKAVDRTSALTHYVFKWYLKSAPHQTLEREKQITEKYYFHGLLFSSQVLISIDWLCSSSSKQLDSHPHETEK